MCDALGIIGPEVRLSPKNSDRSSNEARLSEVHPAVEGFRGRWEKKKQVLQTIPE